MLDRYWTQDGDQIVRHDDHLWARLVVERKPDLGVDPYLWRVTVEGASATGREWTIHRAKLAAHRAYRELTGQDCKLGRPPKTS